MHADWLTLLVIITAFTIYTIRYFTKFDKYEKEPKWRLLLAFIYGIVSVIPALIFSLLVIDFFPGFSQTVLVAPLAEETAKGLFVLLLARSKEFDGPLDGMVYGGLVGAGFAGSENLLYAYNALTKSGLASGVITASFRSVFQIIGHPFFTATFGYGVGAAKVGIGRTKWGTIWKSMLAHGLWNATSGLPGWYFFIGLIVIGLIYLWYLKREFRKAQNLDEKAYERGYYTNDNVKYSPKSK